MGFGSIFSDAWKEIGDNFGQILLFLLFFLIIPITVIAIILVILFVLTFGFAILGNGSVMGNPSLWSFIPLIIVFIISIIILICLYIFAYASFYGMSVKNRKYDWRELAAVGKKSFWRIIGRGILLSLLLMLLYILLIIPGIIFTVYWLFAVFIWFNEPEKGFMESLKRSKELVKGRWWKTLGYLILICLMFFVANIIASFIPIMGGIIGMVLGFYLIYFFRHMYIEYSQTTQKPAKNI